MSSVDILSFSSSYSFVSFVDHFFHWLRLAALCSFVDRIFLSLYFVDSVFATPYRVILLVVTSWRCSHHPHPLPHPPLLVEQHEPQLPDPPVAAKTLLKTKLGPEGRWT
ncbi:MAG: hypothetical protein BECKG1743F_GA0114225_108242 [Candidatus Kentron sp. G]|nr:MAG: hypothetical protein BECKG1743F_GA0114225_108242 [Candidatus Kentron sp. G]